MTNHTGRKLPIHVLEDIKKQGEALAMKEKELLEIKKVNKQHANAIITATEELQLVESDLKQKKYELMQNQAENIVRENVEIKAVVDQSKLIEEQIEQFKLEILKYNQDLKEDENIYSQKCVELSLNHGSLSKNKLEKRLDDIKVTCESLSSRKVFLESQISSITQMLKDIRILEAELETSRSFSKFALDEVHITTEIMSDIHQDIQSLGAKRDSLINGEAEESLRQMEQTVAHLRKKLMEKSSQNTSEINEISYHTVQETNCDKKIRTEKEPPKKFRFMPYELNK